MSAAPTNATAGNHTSATPTATPSTAAEVAALVGGDLRGDPAAPAGPPAGVDQAQPGAVTFLRSRKFAKRWAASKATTAIVSADAVPEEIGDGRAVIVVPNADLAMVAVLTAYAPKPLQRVPGVHKTAHVDDDAHIGQGVHIGPGCVVEAGAHVGDGSVLIANNHLGAHARIGRGCTLHPGAIILERCVMGDASVLHAGAVIGGDGFGYVPDPKTGAPAKLPHIGNVEIGSMVEIGPNTCVDRGKFGATTIGDATKIDNLVQVGHNVTIGRGCIICALTGIAGSVIIGDGVIIGPQVGIADALTIGDRAQLGGQSGLITNMPGHERWIGLPAMAAHTQVRNWSASRSLWAIMRDLKRLEKKGVLRLESLERFQKRVEEQERKRKSTSK